MNGNTIRKTGITYIDEMCLFTGDLACILPGSELCIQKED